MFDEREIEELCDEFMRLDDNTFLGSADDLSKLGDEIASHDFPNLNNNFICYTSDPAKPIGGNRLDVLNENSIHLSTFERFKNSENTANASEVGKPIENALRPAMFLDKKENEVDNEFKEVDEKLTSPDVGKNYFHRNGWGTDTLGLWRSGPSSLNLDQPCNNYSLHQDLTSSVTYNSNEQHSLNTFLSSPKRIYSHQQLGAKVEMVYSLLSMLDMNNREDMSKTFLAMSSSPESCHAMRQSGCLPLLIQLIHSSELNREVRERAAEALHNIVHSQTDEKRRKREVRVLKLLQQVREYCDELKSNHPQEVSQLQASEKHPINAIGTLMKFSFDAEHRQAICILGGLHAISELIQVDYEAHGNSTGDSSCITLRRYAGMSLTNLTFGDCKNKALLCSFNKFMYALVDQLKSPCEDLRQVTASVIRNLSWRADSESKQALRDVGAVTALTVSAMEGKKESTLKSILSALWNLSAHCSLNKVDICSVPGALAFLVKMLKYKSSSNTLAIVENAGGILRNVSSHVAVREDYRQILRDNNCFEVLLEQLKSPSLTIVSNACGTLWNLSARCAEDQRRLWEMGATTMLRSLVQSKHKMISMGSSAALKNLLAANPNENLLTHLDSTAKSLGLQNLPTLFVRKKKALEQELNITLAETCENIDSIESPTYANGKTDGKKGNGGPRRSESRDSVQSTQSDSTYERLNQISIKNEEKLLENKNVTLHDSLDEKSMPRKLEDQKLMRRYKTSMIPTPTFKKVNQDRINERTREGDAQENTATETKYSIKEDSAVKPRPKSLQFPSETQRSSLNNFYSPSNEEYLVRYNERVEAQGGGHAEKPKNAGFNSLPVASDRMKSSTQNRLTENARCERREKNRDESFTKGCNPGVLNVEENGNSVCNGYIPEVSNGSKEVSEYGQFSNHDCLNSSADRHNTPQCVPAEESSISAVRKLGVQNPPKEVPGKVDFSPKDCRDNNNGETLPARESSKVGTLTESKRIVNVEESQPDEGRQGQDEFCISLQNTKMSVDENRSNFSRTSGGAPHTLLARTLDQSSTQQTPLKPNERDNRTRGVAEPPAEPTRNVTKAQPPEMSQPTTDYSAKPNVDDEMEAGCGNSDSVHLKNVVLPRFKVGSPITDRKALQLEANKICREIKKHQDLDMGCSLTSEVSLISCSSFIDMGDYSVFESSTDGVDFDDADNLDLGKVYRFKNPPGRKGTTSQTGESVSLPSLGSLKNEQIEALDLDNSILSVASITSEIAETYTNDNDAFRTYTKTYKVEQAEDTVADATLVSNGEDTLNADSLQNNPELFDDDNSLHSQENLPLDGEVFEEPASDRMRKKLTPKEKRKTFQDRYRTYTIRDINGCKTSEKTNCTGPRDDTMGYTEHGNELYNTGDEGKQTLFPRTVCEDGKYDSFLISTDPRGVMAGFAVDPKTGNELTNIGPWERKELVDNAKLVAFSLKTAVHDDELASDSEPEEPHVDFDTATYSKHHRPDRSGFSSQGLQYVQQYEVPGDEEDAERKGARISKPSSKPDEKAEELPKGIRGRRKPLYSSPQKHHTRTSGSPSNSPKGVKPLPETSTPAKLNREGTFTKDEGLKKTEVKNPRTIPVLYRNVNPARPASGNKPGLPTGNPKRTGETSKIGRPVSSYTAKASERRFESDSSQRRSYSAEGETATGGDGATVTRRPASTGLTSPKMRNSSSNQNVRAGNSPGNGFSGKSKNQSAQNLKSQSDGSLNLVAGKDKGKPKTPKKEVTSKIASLWKKVEESKQKNKNVKDNRVWISSEKTGGEEVLVVEQEEILDIPTRRIVHSRTCEAITDEADSSSQERTSRPVEEFGAPKGRNEKIERRNVISAVVPPYNYKPPVSVKTAPLKVKQVDTGPKGSLRVTTV